MLLRRTRNPAAGLPTTRLEALVDGTAAIVMTLLILEVKVPALDGPVPETLPHALAEMGPEFLTFLMSVAVVGVFWLGHAHQFNFITRVDRMLVAVNVAGLGLVAFVPFTTALLGRYWGESIPTALYGANIGSLGVIGYLHWTHATGRARLVREDTDPLAVQDVRRRILTGLALAAAGIAVSFASPLAGIVLYALAFVPFALPGAFDDHLKPAR